MEGFVPALRAQDTPPNLTPPGADAAQQEALQRALQRAAAARTNLTAAGQVVPFREGATRLTTNLPPLNDPGAVLRTAPRPIPSLRSNSIVVPSGGPGILGPAV